MMPGKASIRVFIRSRWALIISVAVLIIALVIGSYLRYYPVINAERWGYGPTLQELDPYSEYWIAEHLLKHGLGYFADLTRANPVTHIFWYPWGRDFTYTEPPMLSMFSVITYYVAHAINPSLSLYVWMVYLPILFFIMTALGIYFAARELWGDLPAAVAALTAALIFVSRHQAGFTVKYAIGLAFLFPAIYFHVRAWKRGSYVSAVLAGIFLALTALSWAGFNVLLGVIAIQAMLLPLIRKVTKNDILMLFVEFVPVTAAIMGTPFYKGIHYIYASVGIVIPASLVMLLIAYGLQRLSERKEIVLTLPLLRKYKVIYFMLIVLIAVGGLAAVTTGAIVIRGKALFALGLRGLVHGIPTTVQEYVAPSASALITSEGGALIISLIMLVYMLYRVLFKRDVSYLFILILLAASLYTAAHLSYFIPYNNYVVSLTSACFLGVLINRVMSKGFKREWFIDIIALVLVIIYTIAIIAQGVMVWAPIYKSQSPMIINSGIGVSANAPAWLDALNWIRNNAPNGSVCVAWWDYGYWISVVGHCASVADGATLNGTQITLLAKALTGTEEKAYKIFTRDFHIRPDRLYFITYEVYLVDERRGYVYMGPVVAGTSLIGADAAKGIAAIYKIAGRKPPVYMYTYAPYYGSRMQVAVGLPDWTNKSLQNALLFKVLLNTAYVVWGNAGFKVAFLYKNPANPPVLPKPNMTIFKPVYIGISRVTTNLYVVVSVYGVKGVV